MVLLFVEKVPRSLRGELSRWMTEPRAGVFVGNISAMVRDKLWEKVTTSAPAGGAMLVYNAQTEQGYAVRSFGDTSRKIVEMDGITLVCIPEKAKS